MITSNNLKNVLWDESIPHFYHYFTPICFMGNIYIGDNHED